MTPDNVHNAKLIKSLFDKYFEAPLEVWSDFARHMVKNSFKKNETIKAEFKTERYIHLIISGSVGVFLWENDKTRCLDLFLENDFCTDYMSFLSKEPSPLRTMALEETEVISISRSNVEELYYDSITGLQIVRSAAESLFIHKQQQQIELLTMTAEDRYQKMMKENPEMISRIPGKHLASYLGIAPESMSRIRKKYQNQ